MNTSIKQLISSYLTLGVAISVIAQDTPQPPASKDLSPRTTTRRATSKVKVVPPAGKTDAEPEEATLRLNFREAPLETVLNYLSDAAGFTIVLDTKVSGKVDIWNNQPVTKSEAIEILNAALNKNGYAAVQNGKILTIMTLETAKKRNTPVVAGNDPEEMPKTDEVVTQILPVSFITASQLVRDLQAVIPSTATVSANDGGNAIIVTDTRANIRHLAEIIKALDTSVSSIASIRIFPLQYADAKSIASVIKELFAPDTSNNAGGRGGRGGAGGFNLFGGGGNPFGGGGGGNAFGAGGGGNGNGGGGRGGNASTSSRTAAASRVVAVADERSNSVVVSAPDELITTIEELVAKVDTNVEDLTELKVFRLHNADPTEIAEQIGNLFPDDSKSNANNNNPFGNRFAGGGGGGFPGGGGGGGGRGGNATASTTQSDRAKKQGKVIAVSDPRTASVVVIASRDMMRQIETMIARLDSDASRKQRVYVYDLQNADPQTVQEVLKIFESQQNTRNNSSRSGQNTSALNNRQQQQQNSTGSNTRGGGSGFGGGGGGVGGGGGGLGR